MPWQPASILYPDVELVTTNLLRTLFAGRSGYANLYVGNTVPVPRRDQMLVVRRDGGPIGELRDEARINLRAWSPTAKAATDLFSLAAALLRGSAGTGPILRVTQESGPIPVADESEQALRFGVFEIHTRGVQL